MNTTPWYDDVYQLNERIHTLDDLKAACEARQENWRQCTTEVVFLGRIHGGGKGHSQMVDLLNKVLPDTVTVPKVMTWDTFKALLEQYNIPLNACWDWEMKEQLTEEHYQVPSSHIRCPICGHGWTLDNCTDVHIRMDHVDMPLNEYVGKTLKEIQDILQHQRPEAVYWLGFDSDNKTDVRHPGGPSGDPDYFTPEEDEEEQKYWERVELSYVIQEDDRICPFRYQFYHSNCIRSVLQQEYQQSLQEYQHSLAEMLRQVGFNNVQVNSTLPPSHVVEALREEYDEEEGELTAEKIAVELPYFLATTDVGTIGFLRGGEGIPAIDLVTTGVTLQELNVPGWEQAPPNLSFVPIGFDDTLLRIIYHILTTRQNP